MKLLIIGGSGLIGSHILRAAKTAGHVVTGTYRTFPLPDLVPLDCADEGAAAALLRNQKPDAVVHAAGWTWVDGCEDDPACAFEENARQPERLARLCQTRGIHFTCFSTSYVFNGTQGPYAEEATPNPINVYSRSKWEGEQRVQDACGGGVLIPRVIYVYGAEAQRKNFAYQVWRALTEGKTMRLPSDQCGNPTYAADIARWLIALLEKRAAGIWNLAGPQPDCTRDQWAERLVSAFEAAGVKRNKAFAIEAVSTAALKQKALRPLRAGMLTQKLASLGLPPTDFTESIRQMLQNDSEWYPLTR